MPMSDVVQFLEALARNPQGLDEAEYAGAVALLDSAVHQPLLARDVVALTQSLGRPATYACMVTAPDHDEPQQDEKRDDGDENPAEPLSRAA